MVRASDRGGILLELELAPEGASVTKARHAASEIAQAVRAPDIDVKIAVSEAVGNAVLHAFRDRQAGTITLRPRRDRERLILCVSDDGGGMQPNLESPGPGLGLSLITTVADEVHIDSSDSGTTVSMSFGGLAG